MMGLALGLVITAAKAAAAQDLRQSVEFESFFEQEPAWILGLRLGVGGDLQRNEAYPLIGVGLGNVSVNHLYLGGTFDARLTDPHYIRVGARVGVFFRAADLTYGVGVSPALLAVFRPREAGLAVTWGGQVRWQFSRDHFLTAYFDMDLLYDKLGFRDTRQFLSGGLGWAIAF